MHPAVHTDLINRSQLASFIAIGREDFLNLLGDVVRDVPRHLDRIRNVVTRGDENGLKDAAHSLRGMLSYFGCIALTARLASFENRETVAPELAGSLHTELETLWESSLAAINEWEKSVPEFR